LRHPQEEFEAERRRSTQPRAEIHEWKRHRGLAGRPSGRHAQRRRERLTSTALRGVSVA
jgi:hypothetical protein